MTVGTPDARRAHLANLYRAHAPEIYARCRRLLRNRAAAEDASHETFVRVMRHRGHVPPAPETRRWMYRIAVNFCLNALRNARHRAETDRQVGLLAHGSSCSESHLVNRDMVRCLIVGAPVRLRATAWMHHIEGFDQTEVAERLGISRRTVVSRLAQFAVHIRRFRSSDAVDVSPGTASPSPS